MVFKGVRLDEIMEMGEAQGLCSVERSTQSGSTSAGPEKNQPVSKKRCRAEASPEARGGGKPRR